MMKSLKIIIFIIVIAGARNILALFGGPVFQIATLLILTAFIFGIAWLYEKWITKQLILELAECDEAEAIEILQHDDSFKDKEISQILESAKLIRDKKEEN